MKYKVTIEDYTETTYTRSWGACQENSNDDSDYMARQETRWNVLVNKIAVVSNIPFLSWAEEYKKLYQQTLNEPLSETIKKLKYENKQNLKRLQIDYLKRLALWKKLHIKRIHCLKNGKKLPKNLVDLTYIWKETVWFSLVSSGSANFVKRLTSVCKIVIIVG